MYGTLPTMVKNSSCERQSPNAVARWTGLFIDCNECNAISVSCESAGLPSRGVSVLTHCLAYTAGVAVNFRSRNVGWRLDPSCLNGAHHTRGRLQRNADWRITRFGCSLPGADHKMTRPRGGQHARIRQNGS